MITIIKNTRGERYETRSRWRWWWWRLWWPESMVVARSNPRQSSKQNPNLILISFIIIVSATSDGTQWWGWGRDWVITGEKERWWLTATDGGGGEMMMARVVCKMTRRSRWVKWCGGESWWSTMTAHMAGFVTGDGSEVGGCYGVDGVIKP